MRENRKLQNMLLVSEDIKDQLPVNFSIIILPLCFKNVSRTSWNLSQTGSSPFDIAREESGQPPPQMGANLQLLHFSIFMISLLRHTSIPFSDNSSSGENLPMDNTSLPIDSGQVYIIPSGQKIYSSRRLLSQLKYLGDTLGAPFNISSRCLMGLKL